MQAQVGGRVTVTAIRSLHDGESPWWINLRSPDDSPSAVVLRTPSRRVWPDQVATNAAALAVAEKYGLPAPRLLGTDLDGRDAGVPATLETVVAGTSMWPAKRSSGLLRAAGAAIAQVHRFALAPRPHLPFRPRPIAVDDFAQERRLGRMLTTALLQLADESSSSSMNRCGDPGLRARIMEGAQPSGSPYKIGYLPVTVRFSGWRTSRL
jgi:aminoglycoside phosphotransferase (APT) family kinase protein